MQQSISTTIKIGPPNQTCSYIEHTDSLTTRTQAVERQAIALKQGFRKGRLTIYSYMNANNAKRTISLIALANKLGYDPIALHIYSGAEHIAEYAPLASKAGIKETSFTLLEINQIDRTKLCSDTNTIEQVQIATKSYLHAGIVVSIDIPILVANLEQIPHIIELATSWGVQNIYLRYPDVSMVEREHLQVLPSKSALNDFLKAIMTDNTSQATNIYITGLPADVSLMYATHKNILQPNTHYIERALAYLFADKPQPDCYAPKERCALCWLKPHCHALIETKKEIATNNPNTHTANIILTSDCPNNCIFCTFKNMDPPGSTYPHTPIEEIEYQLQRGRELGAEELVFVGTEPLEYKELPSIISTARSMGYKQVAIQTHAEDFADKQFVKLMHEAGLTEVRTGIYGKDAQTHDAITRIKGSFDRLTRAIKNLKESPIRLKLHTTVCRQNLDQLLDIAIWLNKQRLSIEEYKLIAPFTEDIEWYKKVVPTFTEVLRSAAKQFKRAGFWHRKIAEEMLFRLSNNLIPPCVVARIKQETQAPFRIPERREDSGGLAKLQFSIKHVNPDGSIKADFFTHSRHDIKTTISCPFQDSCPYSNECPGIYLWYAKAFGLSEFGAP